jgi:hypothetical protein
MEQLNLLEREKNIIRKDFDSVSNVLVNLMNMSPKKASNNGYNQSFLLEDFEKFLMKLLTHDVLPTREERSAVAKFLHKIHSRREEIALMAGELDKEEIERAAVSLGRKWTVPENEPFGVSIAQ